MARERLKRLDIDADLHHFGARDELAAALADTVAERLSRAIAKRGEAFLAVSGGATPGNFFRALSARPIAWNNVTVTLVDERFVPTSSDRSNEHLVRSTLLQEDAAAARFVGLYRSAADVLAAVGSAARELTTLPWPLDVVVLGMGTDGHTASFFPDAHELDRLLDPTCPDLVVPVEAPSAGETRLTLPLARIAEAPFVALHIEGPEKKRVLDRALEPSSRLPVSSVFRSARNPVQIFWAP